MVITRAVETLATTRRLVVWALSKSIFPSLSAQQTASAAPSRLIKIDQITLLGGPDRAIADGDPGCSIKAHCHNGSNSVGARYHSEIPPIDGLDTLILSVRSPNRCISARVCGILQPGKKQNDQLETRTERRRDSCGTCRHGDWNYRSS
jgi:hypothetical protein